MFATTCKRGLSLFLAVLLCFTAVLGFGTTTAFAAGEQSDVYLVAYPREGDANLDYSGTWGHDNLRYMNGWSSGRSLFTIVRAMGSYEGNICYCIEPGVPLETGDSLSKWGETFGRTIPLTTTTPSSRMRSSSLSAESCSTAIPAAFLPHGEVRMREPTSWPTPLQRSFSFGKQSLVKEIRTFPMSAPAATML